MRSIFVFLSVLALATAAIHQTGPVYRSAASVVNSTPVGKSLPQSQQQQMMSAQPAAEERLAADTSVPVSNIQANQAPAPAAAPATGSTQPQNFKVVFYPNVQQPYTPYAQPATQGTDLWSRYHMNEVLGAGLSIAMILTGGAIWYPRLVNVKARALRQLSEIKSEDASRMAKGILHAIERIYEMNKADD